METVLEGSAFKLTIPTDAFPQPIHVELTETDTPSTDLGDFKPLGKTVALVFSAAAFTSKDRFFVLEVKLPPETITGSRAAGKAVHFLVKVEGSPPSGESEGSHGWTPVPGRVQSGTILSLRLFASAYKIEVVPVESVPSGVAFSQPTTDGMSAPANEGLAALKTETVAGTVGDAELGTSGWAVACTPSLAPSEEGTSLCGSGDAGSPLAEIAGRASLAAARIRSLGFLQGRYNTLRLSDLREAGFPVGSTADGNAIVNLIYLTRKDDPEMTAMNFCGVYYGVTGLIKARSDCLSTAGMSGDTVGHEIFHGVQAREGVLHLPHWVKEGLAAAIEPHTLGKTLAEAETFRFRGLWRDWRRSLSWGIPLNSYHEAYETSQFWLRIRNGSLLYVKALFGELSGKDVKPENAFAVMDDALFKAAGQSLAPLYLKTVSKEFLEGEGWESPEWLEGRIDDAATYPHFAHLKEPAPVDGNLRPMAAEFRLVDNPEENTCLDFRLVSAEGNPAQKLLVNDRAAPGGILTGVRGNRAEVVVADVDLKRDPAKSLPFRLEMERSACEEAPTGETFDCFDKEIVCQIWSSIDYYQCSLVIHSPDHTCSATLVTCRPEGCLREDKSPYEPISCPDIVPADVLSLGNPDEAFPVTVKRTVSPDYTCPGVGLDEPKWCRPIILCAK